MYELVQVSENCYYIQSPAKIGLVKTGEGEVCLIDSGSDKDAGRRVRQTLDANGWTLKAIYNTHSNADHTGGNRYLQQRLGCPIYAVGRERGFINHPVLEPAFLYGGYPFRELRHKFLMAEQSTAHELTEQVLPQGWQILQLPGHFFDMVGFRTPDDVVYLADCLCSEQTLEKYGITFIYDVASYLDTLEAVKQMKAKLFVPAHTQPMEQVGELAQKNIDKVHQIGEHILKVCAGGKQFEEILRQLFLDFGLKMTFEQYVLVGSTVRSYLAWLKDAGRLTARFADNVLLWES